MSVDDAGTAHAGRAREGASTRRGLRILPLQRVPVLSSRARQEVA